MYVGCKAILYREREYAEAQETRAHWGISYRSEWLDHLRCDSGNKEREPIEEIIRK